MNYLGGGMKGRIAGRALVVVLIGGVIALSYYVGWPIRTAGPLAAEGGAQIGPVDVPAGGAVALGFSIPNERLDHSVTLEAVELQNVPQGVRVIGTSFGECTQKMNLCTFFFRRWPLGSPTRAVADVTLVPDGNPHVYVGVQLHEHVGRIRIEGARLFYRDGLRRHVADIDIESILDRREA